MNLAIIVVVVLIAGYIVLYTYRRSQKTVPKIEITEEHIKNKGKYGINSFMNVLNSTETVTSKFSKHQEEDLDAEKETQDEELEELVEKVVEHTIEAKEKERKKKRSKQTELDKALLYNAVFGERKSRKKRH